MTSNTAHYLTTAKFTGCRVTHSYLFRVAHDFPWIEVTESNGSVKKGLKQLRIVGYVHFLAVGQSKMLSTDAQI